jgi:hypothetical protein
MSFVRRPDAGAERERTIIGAAPSEVIDATEAL